MKKPNKIIVCLSSFEDARITMVAKLLVKFGFARTQGDARKIIAFSVFDIDLTNAWFVATALSTECAHPADTSHSHTAIKYTQSTKWPE